MQGTCERYAQIIRALCKTMEDDCPVSLARQRHVSQAGLATISGSAVASRRQGLVLTGAISVNRLPAGFLACISFLLDFIVPLLRLVRVRTLILILIRVVLLVLLVLLRALILVIYIRPILSSLQLLRPRKLVKERPPSRSALGGECWP